MLRIVENYDGSENSVNEALVRVYSASFGEERWYIRRIRADEVKRWFSGPSPGGNTLCFAGDDVVGFCWAWEALDSNSVWVLVDGSLPVGLQARVATVLLSWARLSFERRGVRGTADIRCGFWFGRMHRLMNLVGLPGLEISWGTLMVYRGGPGVGECVVPRGYWIRRCGRGDAPHVAAVLNAAFSRYGWWYPVDVDDVRRRMEREDVMCYVAVRDSGEVVGFVDAAVYEALDGGRTADVGYLAVDPDTMAGA